MAIVASTTASDYSPSWKWVDDEELVGEHVDFRRAAVDGEDRVVWEIRTKLGPVSVWIEPAVLKTKVRAELARRKAARGVAALEPGETVRVNPGTKRPSQRTPGQSVWPFPVVEFEHGVPEQSAEELLLAESNELENTDAGDDALGDDIPF